MALPHTYGIALESLSLFKEKIEIDMSVKIALHKPKNHDIPCGNHCGDTQFISVLIVFIPMP